MTSRRDPSATLMFAEAAQAAQAVAGQYRANDEPNRALIRELQARRPPFVVTCARGSSDHAATFAKYVFETQLGLMTVSAAPSVSSVYAASPQMQDALYIAISQSGRSPDLLQHARMARSAGARVVALVNATDSPLAQLADRVMPMHAGPERSVAATKSYICSLAAILRLAAQWRGDAELLAATDALPQALASAWELDWSAALPLLVPARNLFVIGRGLGLGIAQEAALKLKETCGLHAEAFSAAEVRHGPMALVGPDLPVLCFAQDDETLAGLAELVEEFRARGARVLIAAPTAAAGQQDALPIAQTGHAACTPIAAIQSFYRLVNALALERGRDPDVPPHLRKVTQTV